MPQKKILILLPDGIGIRNFVFTDFYKIGKDMGFDISYWNNTPFNFEALGINSIAIDNPKSHWLTDSYKNARKHIELNLNIRRNRDKVYDTYRFPLQNKTIKLFIKNSITRYLILTHSSERGLKKIRKKVEEQERKTTYYKDCIQTLKKEKPAIVFCTNQRPINGVAPIVAARDLGIPTATFIFSWDNLPKATMVVESDYYFVWSDYMKRELLYYYPYIEEKQIIVTGTPQFEHHFNQTKKVSSEQFYQDHNLDFNKKYICYSGDDITTSPDDAKYLADTANAIRQLNKEGHSLGIIFRRCPVDFSNRYDKVLKDNEDIIIPIDPLWQKMGAGWNTVMPTQSDSDLLMNTVFHSEMVVNLGSSMVFDFACQNKACAFINYDVIDKEDDNWSVKKIYNYVHFRSMPNKKAILWLNSPEEILCKIRSALHNSDEFVTHAKEWLSQIATNRPDKASANVWEEISSIINNI